MQGSHIGKLLVVGALMLAGLACRPAGQAQPGPTTRPVAAAPAALPAKAYVTLAELPPPLDKPADDGEADALPERAVEVVAQAEAELVRENYFKARELLERAQGFAPGSPRVQRGLGLAFAGLNDPSRAEPYLRKSAARAPNHVRVQLLLGQYAAAQDKTDEAVLRCRTALLCGDAMDENPDTGEALALLGQTLEKQECFTAALECYRRLSRLVSAQGRAYADRPRLRELLEQPERLLVDEGRVLLKLSRPAEAAVVLERAYRRDKTHPEAGPLAVKALAAKGDVDRAEGIVMEMLAEPSQHALALSLARELCRTQNDPAAAARMLQNYLRGGGKDSSFVIAMAEVAADMGRIDQAEKMLSSHLTSMPENGRVVARLARLYFRTDDFQAGARQLAMLLAAEGPESSQVFGLARSAAGRGERKDLVVALTASAGQAEGSMRPALLSVAGMFADAGGQTQQAIRLLRQAVAADPKFWPAYEALDRLYAEQQDAAAAKELTAEVAKADADGYFSLYLTGRELLEAGQVEQAIGKLEQARYRKQNHVPTLLLLGRAYSLQGKVNNAEQRLGAAVSLAPDDVEVVREVYDHYRRRGQRAEAQALLARFLEDNPKSVPARLMLARHYLQTNQIGPARAQLDLLAAEAPDDPQVLLLQLSLELPQSLAGEPIPAKTARAALDKLQRVLAAQPSNQQAAMLKAALLINQKRYLEAADALEPLHQRKPQDFRIAGSYLGALAEANAEQRASQAVEKIVAAEKLSPEMRLLVTDSLAKIKHYQRAAELLDKWLSEPMEQGDLARLRFKALQVYEAAEAYDRAQKLIDEWIASAPGEAVVKLLRTQKLRTYARAKEFDQAIAYAKKLLRNEPDSDEPRRALLAVLAEAKAYEKAHAVADEWIAEGGDADKLRYLKATKLMLFGQEGKFDELMRFGEKWIAEDADFPQANRLLISVLLEHKKYDPALKVARQWLAAQEKLAASAPEKAESLRDARQALVQVLLLAERQREALEQAREFAQASPKDVSALRLLYLALSAADRSDEAVSVLEEMYKLDPDDAGTNNDLGYSWADRGIKLEKAEMMIRKALAERPDQVAFKDSLAWALYKQGRFAEAKTIFDQAVIADPEELHPVILDHAGDTCWRLGLAQEAIRLWGQAVEMAKQAERKDRETRNVLEEAPRKISAARSGRAPKVAPLGEAVR